MLERLVQGDTDVLGALYRTYRSEFIHWMTSNYHCDYHEAQDIYQNSIITLSDKVLKGGVKEVRNSIKSYLFGIGRMKYLEYQKEKRKFRSIPTDRITRPDESDLLEKEELEIKLELVEVCLEKLGDPGRSLLELFYFHNMSMEEICKELGYKNAKTTKNLKYKCLNRLRKLFHEEFSKELSSANNK